MSDQQPVLNGEKIYYYRNGNIMYKCNYVNGKKEGKAFRYYPDGQNGRIGAIMNYKNDLLDGEFKMLNEDGTLWRAWNIKYNEDGTIKFVVECHNGKVV